MAKLLLKTLILGILLVVAFLKLDLHLLLNNALAASYLIVSFAAFVAWQLSIAGRWLYCIRKVDAGNRKSTFAGVTRTIFVGNLVSTTLIPSFLGQDAVKLARWRRLSDNFGSLAQSIFITRASGLLGIVVLGLLPVPGLWWVYPELVGPKAKSMLGSDAVMLVGAALAVVIFSGALAGFFLRRKYATRASLSKIGRLVSAIRLLDWRLVAAGVASQVFFVASATSLLLSVGKINPLKGAVISGIAALGRLIPLSILGVSAGEGIQFAMLMALGWERQDIITATGLLVMFLYLTSIAGFLLEITERDPPDPS